MAYKRRNYKKKPYNAKWKFGGTIGRGVPFIGGSKFNFDSRVAKVAKRVALKQAETKEKLFKISTPLMHGNIYTCNLLPMGQGTASGSRIADSIFLCGINFKFEVNTTLQDTFWRFMVLKSRSTWLSSNVNNTTLSTGGFAPSDIFRGGDISPTGYLNSDNITLVASKTLRVKPSQSGETTMIREARANVKVMSKYQFKSDNIYDGQHVNYYLCVVPYNNLSQTAASVGSFTVNYEIVYKDA